MPAEDGLATPLPKVPLLPPINTNGDAVGEEALAQTDNSAGVEVLINRNPREGRPFTNCRGSPDASLWDLGSGGISEPQRGPTVAVTIIRPLEV